MKKSQILIGETRIRKLQSELGSRVWPEFMQHDSTVLKHWPELYTRFLEYQFALFEDEVLLGVGNSLPLCWEQAFSDLPDQGLDWAMEKADKDYKQGRQPTMLVGLQILINPAYQGRGLSYKMLDLMKDIARGNGLTHVALPVRPRLKSSYPLIPMEDYIRWLDTDNRPFDPWIRVHIKAGGKILHTCHQSMDISGTITEWEEWTRTKFFTSGDYIIDQALVPVHINREKNLGLYKEPNVWFLHETSH